MQHDQPHDVNRRRFAMRTTEELESNMTISKGIAMSCDNKDIISIMNTTGTFNVKHVVKPLAPSVNLRVEEIAPSLDRASRDAGYALLPIQTKAVCRIIYRPSATMTVSMRASRLKYPICKTFSTPVSDLRSPVILDMPTGTGKTITALLGSILFAIERKGDIERAQPDIITAVSGATDITGLPGRDPSFPLVPGKCIVFTPRHLIQHWVDHGAIAKRIVEGMAFQDGSTWSVRLVENKFASEEQVGHNEVLVIICDSSRCGVKRYLEPSIYYSSVCFDEAAEKDPKVNAMFQFMQPNIMHGRMLMCSADFEMWGGCPFYYVLVNTVNRHIFPDWEGTYKGHGVAATCYAPAVFNEQERADAMMESTGPLESISFNTATVTYKPSLNERVVGGYGVDLGDDIGCHVFEWKFGVRVSDCLTVNDVISAITNVLKRHRAAIVAVEEGGNLDIYKEYMAYSYDQFGNKKYNVDSIEIASVQRQIELLEKLRPKIKGLLADDCPICLGPMKDLTFLQPCMHCTCKCCHDKLSGECPLCRREMRGIVGVSSNKRPLKFIRMGGVSGNVPDSSLDISEGGSARDSADISDTILPSDARNGDIFCDEMAALCGDNEPGGVIQATYKTLAAIQNARSNLDGADKTLRTMIIFPGVDMREAKSMFEGLGFDVLHYKTSGTKRSPVTRKRMDSLMNTFTTADGKSKLLLVRDARRGSTEDSMTGLDIDGLDCVVSIGWGNLAQRMGRLCRLSRISHPKKEKHALYVEFVPNEKPFWLT